MSWQRRLHAAAVPVSRRQGLGAPCLDPTTFHLLCLACLACSSASAAARLSPLVARGRSGYVPPNGLAGKEIRGEAGGLGAAWGQASTRGTRMRHQDQKSCRMQDTPTVYPLDGRPEGTKRGGRGGRDMREWACEWAAAPLPSRAAPVPHHLTPRSTGQPVCRLHLSCRMLPIFVSQNITVEGEGRKVIACCRVLRRETATSSFLSRGPQPGRSAPTGPIAPDVNQRLAPHLRCPSWAAPPRPPWRSLRRAAPPPASRHPASGPGGTRSRPRTRHLGRGGGGSE